MERSELIEKLHRYDMMRKEMLALERELARECANYGRSKGIWGFRIDHLRLEAQADQAVWERANA